MNRILGSSIPRFPPNRPYGVAVIERSPIPYQSILCIRKSYDVVIRSHDVIISKMVTVTVRVKSALFIVLDLVKVCLFL